MTTHDICPDLSALIAGIYTLDHAIGTKKDTQHLVYITDGETDTEWTEDDADSTVGTMNTNKIELTIM